MKEQTELDRLDHDLRNALAVILGNAQILELSLGKVGMEDERQMAEVIVASVEEINIMTSERIAAMKDVGI